MSRFRREEDEADKWLRDHDPYYLSKGRNKKSMMKYPYETPEQEKRRGEMEIPISSLNAKQRVQLKDAGAGTYNDDGDFNL